MKFTVLLIEMSKNSYVLGKRLQIHNYNLKSNKDNCQKLKSRKRNYFRKPVLSTCHLIFVKMLNRFYFAALLFHFL